MNKNYDLKMGGSLTIRNLLSLSNGRLMLEEHVLNLDGNYTTTGGLIGGNVLSIFNIRNSSDMHIAFSSVSDTLGTLQINKPVGDVSLESRLNIANQIDLVSGRLVVNANNLNILSDATINSSNTNYIVTAGTGKVIKPFTIINSFLFPVGTYTVYAPVEINSVDISEKSVSVSDGVNDYNSGLDFTEDYVFLTWDIMQASGASDIILHWDANATELPGFSLASSYVTHGPFWEILTGSPGTQSAGLSQQSRSNVSDFGIFSVSSKANTPPESADNTITSSINTDYIFQDGDFIFTDADPGDTLHSIYISILPTNGDLYIDFNNDGIINNTTEDLNIIGFEVSVNDIREGNFKFKPVSGGTGTSYTNFKFMVNDSYENSSLDYFMTINILENNSPPEASDIEIYTGVNSDYVFSDGDFRYNDVDGDLMTSIYISLYPNLGYLYIDYNENSTYKSTTEDITLRGNEVLITEIEMGRFKFKPLTDEFGSPYTNFRFFVNDGYFSSEIDYQATINVGGNCAPQATEQIFHVLEYTETGTVVGKIEATDPDTDQTITFTMESGDYTAFDINESGEIIVKDSEMLEYETNPEFNYSVTITDNGIPSMSTTISIIIYIDNDPNAEIIIPNYISPNNDGYNDYWIVKRTDSNIDLYSKVYDNDGNIVYDSANNTESWDGTNKGKKLPPGIYYYRVEYGEKKYQGAITLMH
ncbi:MAG: T9SS type B sorting domain-containing protein [bacterium]|nr:T9SS type B sorting domain-containing protein [bacterium]